MDICDFGKEGTWVSGKRVERQAVEDDTDDIDEESTEDDNGVES